MALGPRPCRSPHLPVALVPLRCPLPLSPQRLHISFPCAKDPAWQERWSERATCVIETEADADLLEEHRMPAPPRPPGRPQAPAQPGALDDRGEGSGWGRGNEDSGSWRAEAQSKGKGGRDPLGVLQTTLGGRRRVHGSRDADLQSCPGLGCGCLTTLGLLYYKTRPPSEAKIKRLQQYLIRRLIELFPQLEGRIEEQGYGTVGPFRAGRTGLGVGSSAGW